MKKKKIIIGKEAEWQEVSNPGKAMKGSRK